MSLITPQQIRDVTTSSQISALTDAQLNDAITLAECKLSEVTGRPLDDSVFVPTLPDRVRVYLIRYAEWYALQDLIRHGSSTSNLNSESYDDYSYTRSTTTDTIQHSLSEPDLYCLVEEYVTEDADSGVRDFQFRMTAI